MADDRQTIAIDYNIDNLTRKYNHLMKRKADFELKFVAMLGERATIDSAIKCNMMQQMRYYTR